MVVESIRRCCGNVSGRHAINSSDRTLSSLGSFVFLSCPLLAAWNFNTAEIVAFGALSFYCGSRYITADSSRSALLWGLASTYSLITFAQYLYPPHQFAIATAFIFLFMHLIIRDDEMISQFLKSPFKKLLGLALIMMGLGAVECYWYISAYDSIKAMRETLYPGAVTAAGGGLSDFSFFLIILTYFKLMLETF